MKLLEDGNFTGFASTVLALLGTAFILAAVVYAVNKWQFVAGVFIGATMVAIASASLKARVLRIKPFTRDPLGWRAAKETYKVNRKSERPR